MYYLAIIQNESTSTLFTYSTFEEALAAYHTELAYRSDDRTSTKCVIFDSELRTLRAEVYEKPVDTTPTEEPTEGEQ